MKRIFALIAFLAMVLPSFAQNPRTYPNVTYSTLNPSTSLIPVWIDSSGSSKTRKLTFSTLLQFISENWSGGYVTEIPAGALFSGNTDATELGALDDSLFVDSIPYTTVKVFGQQSTNYRIASFDWVWPANFTAIDSIALEFYCSATDQDSLNFTIQKSAIAVGETVDPSWDDSQEFRHLLTASASDRERVTLTSVTGTVEAGDWWFMRLVRIDGDSNAETDDVSLAYVFIYWH